MRPPSRQFACSLVIMINYSLYLDSVITKTPIVGVTQHRLLPSHDWGFNYSLDNWPLSVVVQTNLVTFKSKRNVTVNRKFNLDSDKARDKSPSRLRLVGGKLCIVTNICPSLLIIN